MCAHVHVGVYRPCLPLLPQHALASRGRRAGEEGPEHFAHLFCPLRHHGVCLIHLFDNSLISCLCGRVRAPTYQLWGRRDGFAWRNLIWFFSGEGVGEKKNTQEWTIMDLKIESGEECSVGEEGKPGVCLHRADLPYPLRSPRDGAASLPRGGARGREGKWGGSQDGEMSHRRSSGLDLGCTWECPGKGPTPRESDVVCLGCPQVSQHENHCQNVPTAGLGVQLWRCLFL